MKYAVEYWNEGEDREPRRTRFISLSTAKKKKKMLEKDWGHKTRMIPRNELPDEPKHTVGPSIMNRDVINNWQFINDVENRDEVPREKPIYTGMICVKNGGQYPLHKVP